MFWWSATEKVASLTYSISLLVFSCPRHYSLYQLSPCRHLIPLPRYRFFSLASAFSWYLFANNNSLSYFPFPVPHRQIRFAVISEADLLIFRERLSFAVLPLYLKFSKLNIGKRAWSCDWDNELMRHNSAVAVIYFRKVYAAFFSFLHYIYIFSFSLFTKDSLVGEDEEMDTETLSSDLFMALTAYTATHGVVNPVAVPERENDQCVMVNQKGRDEEDGGLDILLIVNPVDKGAHKIAKILLWVCVYIFLLIATIDSDSFFFLKFVQCLSILVNFLALELNRLLPRPYAGIRISAQPFSAYVLQPWPWLHVCHGQISTCIYSCKSFWDLRKIEEDICNLPFMLQGTSAETFLFLRDQPNSVRFHREPGVHYWLYI